jgi:hypothetical protein
MDIVKSGNDKGDDDNINFPGTNQGVTGLNQGSHSVGRSVGRSGIGPASPDGVVANIAQGDPPPRLKERDAFVFAAVDTLTASEGGHRLQVRLVMGGHTSGGTAASEGGTVLFWLFEKPQCMLKR